MQKSIQSSLDYIEQNLKTDITTDELAQLAGYSAGHFCRMFSQTMSSSITGYILKRRLDNALSEMASGRKNIDIALEYGFDTYAGFYKAFVKMYGCSPKNYLRIYTKEVSFMFNENDIRTILENWDIPGNLEINDISQSDWRVWQIGSDYYLKTNERSKMIRNMKIAKALHKHGLSSEFLPIPTKTGSDYLDGEHIFLLTRKIGKPLNNRPLSDDEVRIMGNNVIREKNAFMLGKGIARLHMALKSIQDDVNPDEANLYKQGVKAISKVKDYTEKYAMELADGFNEDYIENFGRLYEKLPKQLVHGNPVGDSAVYENGEVVCFKGFELYNLKHIRLFDVIYCAGEINAQPSVDLYLTTLKEILRGYDSINPLTDIEKQSVYYVLCSIAMNMIEYCDETLDVSKRNREALTFLTKNKERFVNLL